MAQCEIVFTDILVEFLEVALNNILYGRKVYPDESFVEKKIYSTVVHVCQHPQLIQYIKNVLQTISGLLAMDNNGGISAINIKFFDKDKRLVEKYVFNLMHMDKDHQRQKRDCYYTETEQMLRSLILKTSMAVSYLDPLPQESTFSMDIDARRWAYIALSQNSMSLNFPWILNDESTWEKTPALNHPKETNLLPLINIKNDWLHLEVFVLKINEKLKR